MNLKGIFYDEWEVESKFIDSNEDCNKAFGYDELHLTSDTIEKLKHGKDLIVDIQGGEYVLRIMWKEIESEMRKKNNDKATVFDNTKDTNNNVLSCYLQGIIRKG